MDGWPEAAHHSEPVAVNQTIGSCLFSCRSQAASVYQCVGYRYYGPHDDEVLDESNPPGVGFLADLCVQWEAAARDAATHDLRIVWLRTGMVLEKDGGALPRMALPFRFFMGGPVMPGDPMDLLDPP